MCLHKALQPGVRSCSWKPSGQLNLSHTKHTVHMILLSISHSLSACLKTHLLPIFSPSSSLPNLRLLSITLPFLPPAFTPPFLSQKLSYSLMHGSCREQCYFIFPWQRPLCFSGSHFSFGSNVLLCQC